MRRARGPVLMLRAGEVKCTINLFMYVNGIFAKNMSKNHIFSICDALAQKVLITRKLVFSLI